MNMFKSNGGFTLVELIVVIAILAILAGVAVPAYSGYIARANDSTVTTALEAAETAAKAAASMDGKNVKAISVAANGTVTAYVNFDAADKDGKTDGKCDPINITEFFKETIDLSKHSEYAGKGCNWDAATGKWTVNALTEAPAFTK